MTEVDLQINWIGVLMAAAGLHGIYLAILLFFRRQSLANRFVAIIAILISLRIFDYLGYLTRINLVYPDMYNLSGPFKYLIAPIYFFFVLLSINRKRQFRSVDLLHIIIPIYFLIRQVPGYFATEEHKLASIMSILNPHREYMISELFISQLYLFQILAYVVLAHFEIRKASTGKRSWRRLQQFNMAFAIFIALDFGIKLVAFGGLMPGGSTEYLLLLSMALLIHSLGYLVITPPEVVSIQANGNGEKYRTSPLTVPQLNEYRQKVTSYFENTKPYLNCNLKITDTAAALQIPAHHLSQVMSQEMKTSFNDFVNSYRVEFVKNKLKDPKNRRYKLMSIAFDSGFSNKTSFNRAFKRVTGITPSEYLKSLEE